MVVRRIKIWKRREVKMVAMPKGSIQVTSLK